MWRRKGKRGKVRVRGASTSGASWTVDPHEYDVMQALLIDMTGKKVFVAWLDMEYEAYVNESVLEIRDMLSGALKIMPERAHSYASVSAMREASNRYLQATPQSHSYAPSAPLS